MKKPSIPKRQRLSAYKKMLKLIKNEIKSDGWYGFGFCNALQDIYFLTPYNYAFYTNINNYPELMKYKPDRNYHKWGYWFTLSSRGDKKRIKILETIINEMKTK